LCFSNKYKTQLKRRPKLLEDLKKYNAHGFRGTIPWVTNNDCEKLQTMTIQNLLVARKDDEEINELKTRCAVFAAISDIMPFVLPKR
jgi:hypothetical protein